MNQELSVESRGSRVVSQTGEPIHNPQNVKRIPLLPDEPQTLAELFRQTAEKHSRPNTLNYKKDGVWNSISSKELIERAENIALGLYSIGMRKGDRAALLAANSPEWTLTDAGCQFVGIVDVPIYTTLADNSVCYITNDAGARIFFLDNKETFDRISGIFSECKTVEKLIFFNSDGIEAENAMSLAELETSGAKLKKEQPELIKKLSEAIAPNDVATLIYTSGTTGEPKGVMLSHANILSNVIDVGENFSFTEADVPLSVLPLSHVFERSGMYLYLFNGMAVHYAESIEKVSDNLREVRPTIFVGVPRLFEKVYAKGKLNAANASPTKEKIFDWAIEIGKEYTLKKESGEQISFFLGVKHSIADKLVFSKFREVFGGRLRFCITGGAALSNDIFLIFNGAGVKIMQGYGLTETSPVITSSNPINVKLGTVGKTIRNVQIRFAPDGEIEVQSPGALLGYYNKPEATREIFTEDGWFKTGDIGELDEDGYLKITDRKKELFKTSGGKYIAPSPIEQMIKSSRFVSQVVLVGNDRKFPAALIVPNFDQLARYAKSENLNLKSPQDFCESEKIVELLEKQVGEMTGELSKYEKVKKIALLKEELTVESGELTPTLKVKRRVVNEKYKEMIEKIYAE